MSHDMPMMMPMPMPNDNNTMSDMSTMHMTFFWGSNVVMLFNDWPNGKLGMYILALVLVFLVAVAIQFLSEFQPIKTGASPFVGALAQALFYGLRMALAYLVMLAVMSYNLGVFIFAVLGHTVGFFLVKYRAALKAKNDLV
uniref:copper transporter 2-like n=1 Tax=Erigeron canadensis TaxID=72917 RepID=UPI001CB937E6|nr:copper transporter 2-like [Erigeron canadensis]